MVGAAKDEVPIKHKSCHVENRRANEGDMIAREVSPLANETDSKELLAMVKSR